MHRQTGSKLSPSLLSSAQKMYKLPLDTMPNLSRDLVLPQSCDEKASEDLPRTDKKENKLFLIDKEIQIGAVAKSYMRKGFLIYEEMSNYFPFYEEAVSHI